MRPPFAAVYAATVIPAMADKAAKVTMLQRSPTYFMAAPNVNELYSGRAVTRKAN